MRGADTNHLYNIIGTPCAYAQVFKIYSVDKKFFGFTEAGVNLLLHSVTCITDFSNR